MLDEVEFAEVYELYMAAFRSVKATEVDDAADLPDLLHARFEPARAAYRRITGFDEQNEAAIMHHRLSLYGPPCRACGKPLRTPQAKHCAACGTSR